jgi:hypothetical protein
LDGSRQFQEENRLGQRQTPDIFTCTAQPRFFSASWKPGSIRVEYFLRREIVEMKPEIKILSSLILDKDDT